MRASINDIINSRDASVWLKDALRAALRRDACDAANDAEILVALLVARANGGLHLSPKSAAPNACERGSTFGVLDGYRAMPDHIDAR